MDNRKLGLGLGLGALAAGIAGAAAWAFGGELARRLRGQHGGRVGAVPGDSTTSPIDPRPATMAAAPVGMAETEKHFREHDGSPAAEHVPSDLLAADPVTTATRAPEDFRPDPTAVPTKGERDSLRPATGPAPTLTSDRGSGFSEAAGAA